MKAFFIGDRKDKSRSDEYQLIIDEFESQGTKVDRTHFVRTSEIDSKNVEEAYLTYMKSIKSNDIVIAEVTEMSSGIGFMIATALDQKKPVIALFDKNSKLDPSKTLTGSTNKLLSFCKYDKENLSKVIKDFQKKANDVIDTKFILIISPEIDRYLTWVSDNRRMHKAQVVRLALEDVMEKDKEYKDYVKAN
jgi:nucleoside 2-deoxyribosyltransferase